MVKTIKKKRRTTKKATKKTAEIKGVLPIILIILDGWGITKPGPGNAISLAKTPNMNKLEKEYPYTTLFAHGKYVGLPKGQEGNSEAGHMNIGAGRIVDQDATIINKSIEDRTFFKNTALLQAIKHVKENKSRLHLMGMLSDEHSPHSDTRHIFSILEIARKNNIKEIYIHLFTDGRDSPQYAGLKMAQELEGKLRFNEKIVTIMGRFYSMDRKKKWDRTKEAYEALVNGKGEKCITAITTITQSYNQKETDEFIKPHIIGKKEDYKKSRIKDNDSIIFFNLRSDRARQLTKVFVQKNFNKLNPKAFTRKKMLKNLSFVALTDFGPDLDSILTAYPSIDLKNTLPFILWDIKQLYMAETEKHAHVTYFFNGGYPRKIAREEHYIVPSPNVDHYDDTPSMKSGELTKKTLENLKNKKYDFTFLNFAAPDMIGHTGNLEAAITCCEKLDQYVEKIVKSYLAKNGTVIITADHGNLEEMIDLKTKKIITKHSTNPVPFILVNKKYKSKKLRNGGILSDIVPTILKLLGKQKPAEMTGKSLIEGI